MVRVTVLKFAGSFATDSFGSNSCDNAIVKEIKILCVPRTSFVKLLIYQGLI